MEALLYYKIELHQVQNDSPFPTIRLDHNVLGNKFSPRIGYLTEGGRDLGDQYRY